MEWCMNVWPPHQCSMNSSYDSNEDQHWNKTFKARISVEVKKWNRPWPWFRFFLLFNVPCVLITRNNNIFRYEKRKSRNVKTYSISYLDSVAFGCMSCSENSQFMAFISFPLATTQWCICSCSEHRLDPIPASKEVFVSRTLFPFVQHPEGSKYISAKLLTIADCILFRSFVGHI